MNIFASVGRIRLLRSKRESLLLLLLLLVVAAARAGDSVPNYFDIPGQSMDAALIEFSEQANIQVMIASELVENLKSTRVKGRYLPEDALTLLIAGSGLTFHAVGENAIAVVRDDGM